MPHTPEGFLENIDDNMECASENGGTTMDANDISLCDNIDSTDDLVPSLQVMTQFNRFEWNTFDDCTNRWLHFSFLVKSLVVTFWTTFNLW